MSTIEKILITCDKCGLDISEAAVRRTLTLDGRPMVLDLCADDDKAMTAAFEPWTAVALDANPDWIMPLGRKRRRSRAR